MKGTAKQRPINPIAARDGLRTSPPGGRDEVSKRPLKGFLEWSARGAGGVPRFLRALVVILLTTRLYEEMEHCPHRSASRMPNRSLLIVVRVALSLDFAVIILGFTYIYYCMCPLCCVYPWRGPHIKKRKPKLPQEGWLCPVFDTIYPGDESK